MGRRKKPEQLTRRMLNVQTYMKAPTYEQIKDYVYNDLKISMLRFEAFFGIPRGTMKQVSFGINFPAKYWHIVYEKKKPAYGVGIYKELPVAKKAKPNPVTAKKHKENEEVNKAILDKMNEYLK